MSPACSTRTMVVLQDGIKITIKTPWQILVNEQNCICPQIPEWVLNKESEEG